MTTVLEVTELAISGSKSRTKTSEIQTFKEEKSRSPVSHRVSDVAEELLSTIFQKVSYLPDVTLFEKCSTKLDERHILSLICQGSRVIQVQLKKT